MDINRAKEIVQKGFAWANWSPEQAEAFRTLILEVEKFEQLNLHKRNEECMKDTERVRTNPSSFRFALNRKNIKTEKELQELANTGRLNIKSLKEVPITLSYATLVKLAQVLNVSIDFLIGKSKYISEEEELIEKSKNIAGDIFITENKWEDISEEFKNQIHDRFENDVNKHKSMLYELYSENIIQYIEINNITMCLYKIGENVYLFKKFKKSSYLVYVNTFNAIKYNKNITDANLKDWYCTIDFEELNKKLSNALN